ncbi:MAG: sigma-54-dependent Fis family transcriptional regulator [Firmicutes bacterium]|nr:sigma-54-dependent Fis family transcriptional regulator [Bacillota bacterium]
MSSKASFLIVDDEQEVCNFFSYLLKQKGYRVITANSGTEAMEIIAENHFNTALVDLKLPDANGLDILKAIKGRQPDCEVIIITGYSTVKSAVEAIQLGALDYVEKPFVDINEMEALLDKSLTVRPVSEELSKAIQEQGFIIGRSQKMLNLISAAQKIAKKNITILIQGETGTGKEVLARYIHSVSHRSDRPFLAFNCGAFTETLLESELFGHEKGSFTGATHRKKGIFELAHKATLFLDEIDSASPAIQIKLLRVLETGEFLRVGGEEMCKIDVRIITATNADLAGKVAENKFREDLFYRLDVASLNIPPLRERQEDIELFIEFFLGKEAQAKQISLKQFSPEALELIKKHEWPGNIRELSNTVAQALLLSKGNLIEVEDLPERIRREFKINNLESLEQQMTAAVSKSAFACLPETGEKLNSLLNQFADNLFNAITFREGFDFELFNTEISNWRDDLLATLIEKALDDTYGNQVKAAELLQVTPRALRYHLQKARKKDNTNQS